MQAKEYKQICFKWRTAVFWCHFQFAFRTGIRGILVLLAFNVDGGIPCLLNTRHPATTGCVISTNIMFLDIIHRRFFSL